MSDYKYIGPGSTLQGNMFMVHATLEHGAEKYFSGLRVVIGCKGTPELAGLVRTHCVLVKCQLRFRRMS